MVSTPIMMATASLRPDIVFTFNDTISTDVGSYDVDGEATTAGWNGTSIVVATITVASGGRIIIFTTGSLVTDSTVDLIIQTSGEVFGTGGDGGIGGVGATGSAGAGTAGGSAIDFQVDGTITTDAGAPNGEISGGGGGGGGGDGGSNAFEQGGGGGGGFPDGSLGIGNPNGAVGTTTGGGIGGVSAFGDGGAGGDEAAIGTAGAEDGSSGSAGASGAAGSAIEKNGNTVTVTNNGTINGTINA